jgi:hypothetical protein
MFKEDLKIYPLAQAAKPPKMEFISGSKVVLIHFVLITMSFIMRLQMLLSEHPLVCSLSKLARSTVNRQSINIDIDNPEKELTQRSNRVVVFYHYMKV